MFTSSPTSRVTRAHHGVLPLLLLFLFASSVNAKLFIDWQGPDMPWNPETIATCRTWDDPRRSKHATCESFRASTGLSPEQFHEFNPSVGINCEGWREFQSYCVADESQEDEFWQTNTNPIFTSMMPLATVTPLTVTAAVTGAAGTFGAGTGVMVDATPVPSPKVVSTGACLRAKNGENVLSKKLDSVPGQSMTNQLCRARCWAELAGKESFFVRLRNGNECWCGRKLLVDYLEYNAMFDQCRVVCEGDKDQFCGGKEHMSYHQAVIVYGTGLAWGMKPQSSIVVANAGAGATHTGSVSGNGQHSMATGGRGIVNMGLTMMVCIGAAVLCVF